MPANFRSYLYFVGKKNFTRLLWLIGDPIGRFEYSPDLLTFNKNSKPKRVQRSITGILISADHEICSDVLKSPNWLSRPFAERLYLGAGGYAPGVIHPFLDSIIALDGADQRRIKKVMYAAFSPAETNRWRKTCEIQMKNLIDQVKNEVAFDFVSSFSNPLPLEVICKIIGVPREYIEQCNRWGRTLAGIGLDLPKNNRELGELEKAAMELTELISKLLQERKKSPKKDLLSVMLEADSEGQKLEDSEIIASAAFTLIAGFETTMNLFSVGTLLLLENPDQLELLSKKPDLIPNFIEEALRLTSPIQFVVRTAETNQILADGTKVRKGQTIILNLASANRDPKVFNKPNDFDIQRENAKKNVSFGFGAHHCIGSILARVEAEVFWQELLSGYPDVSGWKLSGEPIYEKSKLIRSISRLPVSLQDRG